MQPLVPFAALYIQRMEVVAAEVAKLPKPAVVPQLVQAVLPSGLPVHNVVLAVPAMLAQ